jgi:predicted nucleic acid-binding protein
MLFLIDSSALWRVGRDADIRSAWTEVIVNGVIGSCQPQRVEFRRSARDLDEFEEMNSTFEQLYPDVPVPKAVWQWIDTAQYQLLRRGAHRALSTVDLLICATAAHHGLVILHDDHDFETAARHLPDVQERNVNRQP